MNDVHTAGAGFWAEVSWEGEDSGPRRQSRVVRSGEIELEVWIPMDGRGLLEIGEGGGRRGVIVLDEPGEKQPRSPIQYVWGWWPEDEDVVVVGRVVGPDGEGSEMAVVRVARANPLEVERLLTVPEVEREAMEVLQAIDQGIRVTSVNGRAVAWVPEEEPAIYVEKSGGGMRRLESLPRELKRPPGEALARELRIEERMVILEGSSLVSDIIGWDGRLYVIHHRWAIPGPEWYVTEIDVEQDVVEATARIPSNARSLVVVAGPEEWTIFEKERERLAYQATEGALRVPAGWIEAMEDGGVLCGAKPRWRGVVDLR